MSSSGGSVGVSHVVKLGFKHFLQTLYPPPQSREYRIHVYFAVAGTIAIHSSLLVATLDLSKQVLLACFDLGDKLFGVFSYGFEQLAIIFNL